MIGYPKCPVCNRVLILEESDGLDLSLTNPDIVEELVTFHCPFCEKKYGTILYYEMVRYAPLEEEEED